MNLVNANIEHLAPYEAGKPLETLERELGVTNAIKLASNENPLGPSPRAMSAATKVMCSAHRYPDAAAFALRERIAQKLAVSADEVIQGNGSSEVIDLALRTFVDRGQHVIFGEPSFSMYRIVCAAAGVPFTAVPLRELTHDLDAMAAAVTEATRMVLIANPNNPTGTYVSRRALADFLQRVPEWVTVLVDEAYFEYADATDFPDTLTMRAARKRLIVTRTFSKIYGLAAQRIGYGIAPATMIDYMNRVRPPFNVGTVGQVAATAALDDDEHVEKSRALNRRERARLSQALAGLGVRVTPSQANFVYVVLNRAAKPVFDALLRLGVIVRTVPDPLALRITVGLPEENDRFLSALTQVLRT
jgi:histidinol-phosphate aminotransferase